MIYNKNNAHPSHIILRTETKMKRSRFFELTRIIIILLCASMLCACTQGGEGSKTEDITTTADETTGKEEITTESNNDTLENEEGTTEPENDTLEKEELTTEPENDTSEKEEITTESENDTTEKEEETSEVMKAPQLTSEISERYFVFRIWNFTITPYETFTYTVDEAVKSGFNAIKVHIPWALVQPDANTMNFSEFDRMIDYVVSEKGLKVAISIDLTRRATDALIGQEHIQRVINGNLCVGGSHAGDRTVISFCSDYAVNKAIDFYKTAVAHYENLYGNSILFYLPAFNPYCETEYWAAAEYDYSALALAAFSDFLKEEYGSVNAMNAALGTSYNDFEAVIPPPCNKADVLGTLWYRFRHERLKAVIDGLARAQRSVAPRSEFAVQFGSVFDDHSAIRGTLAFTDLCEHVDVLWVDDGPTYDHSWSMDYIRAALDGEVKLAQEIDGPLQNEATPERYLDQGLTAFEHGATYVSAANWSIDQNYRDYEHVWRQISDTWLGKNHPEVKMTTENTQILEISLLSRFRRGGFGADLARYQELGGKEGAFVYIRIIDDLSNAKGEALLPFHSFPGDFSSTQGENGWYYRSHRKGKFFDMTFSDGMWRGKAEYTLVMNGSVHTDDYDAAIIFKADKDGAIEFSYTLSLASNESDGVEYTVFVNGKPTTELGEDFIYLPYGDIASGALVLQVKQGDEVALVVNKHVTKTSDTTSVNITVEYLN